MTDSVPTHCATMPRFTVHSLNSQSLGVLIIIMVTQQKLNTGNLLVISLATMVTQQRLNTES